MRLTTYVIVACCFVTVFGQDVFVSNLDRECLKCLCYAATRCNLRSGCNGGHCGPYQIGYQYWKDAGSPTLAGHHSHLAGAFESCALMLPCAQGTVKNYIANHGRDCNQDGVTNCDDYAMVNFNGAFECEKPLNTTAFGREFWRRYKECRVIK